MQASRLGIDNQVSNPGLFLKKKKSSLLLLGMYSIKLNVNVGDTEELTSPRRMRGRDVKLEERSWRKMGNGNL